MLKNILSLLLSKFYSKQESEAVGHQAMPSPSNTVSLLLSKQNAPLGVMHTLVLLRQTVICM